MKQTKQRASSSTCEVVYIEQEEILEYDGGYYTVYYEEPVLLCEK